MSIKEQETRLTLHEHDDDDDDDDDIPDAHSVNGCCKQPQYYVMLTNEMHFLN